MAEVELIGVPFDGYGRTGNQALAATALRDAGLVAAFGGHVVVAMDDLDLPPPSARRGGDTGLINEAALIVMTDALNDRVGRAVSAGRFPVVYGADCSTLLGTVSGLRDRLGDVGLVFIDGHEDTMPLDVSEDGEAANAELGLLLGLTGRLLSGPLEHRLPALRSEALAVLGPRDEAWRRQFNVGSLRDRAIWFRSDTDVAADPVTAGRGAAQHVQAEADRWWLHVDLDVLDPAHFEAQGLPEVDDEPGGLTWRQLTDLLIAAVETGGCLGWSLAIYDPDQDPHRTDARQIVELVGQVARTIR
jgi:arginase